LEVANLRAWQSEYHWQGLKTSSNILQRISQAIKKEEEEKDSVQIAPAGLYSSARGSNIASD
jgi:hypothetical protein